MDIKKDDVVTLKSGGPMMTVRGIGTQLSDTEAVCDYWDGSVIKNGAFEVGQLKIYEEPIGHAPQIGK